MLGKRKVLLAFMGLVGLTSFLFAEANKEFSMNFKVPNQQDRFGVIIWDEGNKTKKYPFFVISKNCTPEKVLSADTNYIVQIGSASSNEDAFFRVHKKAGGALFGARPACDFTVKVKHGATTTLTHGILCFRIDKTDPITDKNTVSWITESAKAQLSTNSDCKQ